MHAEKFVNLINSELCEGTPSDILALLKQPPGRSPSSQLIKLSNWFNGLDENDREAVFELLKMTAKSSIFGFLCMLDGVRQIEGPGEKNTLELWYKKNDERVLINDPDQEMLHDLLP